MIEFILNNKHIKTKAKTGMTLVDFIRENQELKGTKIGCREGDCGACTVLLGTLHNEKVQYKSITSCISPLGNAHGKHIVTIEGINLEKKLTVVQNTMLENFATQCGFCTPGFVVSLTGYAMNSCCSEANQIDAISGNICRCTGYKSIEKAANQIAEKVASTSISDLIKQGFIPEYFTEIPNKLALINYKINKIDFSETIVANGTDLYVRYADNLSEKEISLVANLPKLKGISVKNDICKIGASTTVSEIVQNTELQQIIPNLKAFLKLISSEQIRNMGTLAGNFVNASPIGDMSIFFLALDTTLHIQNIKTKKEREIPFKEFHQDYKKYDLQKEELIVAISFPVLTENTFFNFEKVSKRTHLDIASVNAACSMEIENNTILKTHFSIGGVAAIPKYLKKTNNFLKGKSISEKNIQAAEQILQSEISPIADVRGTIEYKRLLARQLFFAHFVALFPQIKLKNLL